jgi:proton-translocating NADH-quinone oxidoreductase chain L
MYLLIIALPLMASIVAGLGGRFVGRRGAALITTSSVAFTALLSLVAFYEVGLSGSPCSIALSPWFVSDLFQAHWGFYFDSLTVVMLVVVNVVSTLVHLYSIGYMSEDPHVPRFMSYLSIFTFFMIILVTSDNFVQLFFGWEGVGLASYLLINFWFTRVQANKASIKAMVMNRVGDIGLALGTLGIFLQYQSVDYATVFACAPHAQDTNYTLWGMPVSWSDITCLLLFVGAMGKSAQLGLHTWLPDAMEGPTPVSALIHAATMVTAGVFLLARLSPLYEQSPIALSFVAVIGAMTCIFAATTGAFQHDMKRVIAYSTASQLGYMVLACGLSQYALGVFHLANHAFFKALLFLSAGSVIHAMSDEQDMRRMGGLVRLLPMSYAITLVGTLALVGWPFLTGFYSKDVILEISGGQYTSLGNFGWWIASLVVFLTSYYSFRLLFLVFLAPPRSSKVLMPKVHESPIPMALPLIFLAIGSIVVGYVSRDMMIGLGSDFWGNAVYTLPHHDHMVEAEYLPQYIRLMPFILTLAGLLVSYILCIAKPELNAKLLLQDSIRQFMRFCNRRWFIDVIYNNYLGKPVMAWGYWTSFRALDRGALEMVGPQGISKVSISLAQRLRTMQSGYMYHYAIVMLVGLTFMIAMATGFQGVVDPRIVGVVLVSCLLTPVL